MKCNNCQYLYHCQQKKVAIILLIIFSVSCITEHCLRCGDSNACIECETGYFGTDCTGNRLYR